MEDLETRSEDSATNESGSGSKLGMALGLVGVVGILLGAVGIVMANNSRKEIESLKAEIAAQPDKTAELEAKFTEFNERLNSVGERTVQLDKKFTDQFNNLVAGVGKEIRTNRELISQLSDKMASAPAPKAAAAKAAAAKDDGGSGGPTADKPAGGIHKIAAGDNFGKLAAKYGVTVDAIRSANPGVEPTKLQIGQEIKIP
ncbi:MAG: LysM domain-containing protein [Verrucomicrobiota bacterium]|nr:LysM domain-containing protein [Verrucomicrobiota bacterium]